MRDGLRHAGVWLFGRRPVRPQRPVRRIGPLVFGLGCLIALLTGQAAFATAIVVTGVVLLLASELI